jgi:hypothetical protein
MTDGWDLDTPDLVPTPRPRPGTLWAVLLATAALSLAIGTVGGWTLAAAHRPEPEQEAPRLSMKRLPVKPGDPGMVPLTVTIEVPPAVAAGTPAGAPPAQP